MTHQHTNTWRARRFRVFVTNQYYANRDEYFDHGQQQPYTFAEYYAQNKSLLRDAFRKHRAAAAHKNIAV